MSIKLSEVRFDLRYTILLGLENIIQNHSKLQARDKHLFDAVGTFGSHQSSHKIIPRLLWSVTTHPFMRSQTDEIAPCHHFWSIISLRLFQFYFPFQNRNCSNWLSEIKQFSKLKTAEKIRTSIFPLTFD